MSLPEFFNSIHAARYDYRCDFNRVIAEAEARRADIKGSPLKRFDIEMLTIDAQRDFGFPQGGLFVSGRSGKGAIDDSIRLAKFIYKHAAYIDAITPTLDTHTPVQIFFPSFWTDEDGAPVAPFTTISVSDLQEGKYFLSQSAYMVAKGNKEWANNYVEHYCQSLAEKGRYELTIWPWHCLLGSPGHSLIGVIEEAIFYHSWLRGVPMQPFLKGSNPWTEEYSALSAEVVMSHDSRAVAEDRSAKLVKRLLRRKALIVAGQAASHCVRSTLEDLLQVIRATDPSLAQRVYILRDCMSSVVVPNLVDYTEQTDKAMDRFREAGMHVVDSTTPLTDWPGIPSR